MPRDRMTARSTARGLLRGAGRDRVEGTSEGRTPPTTTERSCSLARSRGLGRAVHPWTHRPTDRPRGQERCESGRIGLTANPRFEGLRHESSASQCPHQARCDACGHRRTRKYRPSYRPRSQNESDFWDHLNPHPSPGSSQLSGRRSSPAWRTARAPRANALSCTTVVSAKNLGIDATNPASSRVHSRVA